MRIQSIETFTRGRLSIVRVRTDDGAEGYGQIAPFNADISATVLHRQVAPHALGADPLDIESLVDRCIEANYKFPWSYVCRATGGLETALWDLRGNLEGKSVCELLGGTPRPIAAYGSSMRRDIQPADEAERLARLMDSHGFRAFKIRIGSVCGRDEDQWDGRTEELAQLPQLATMRCRKSLCTNKRFRKVFTTWRSFSIARAASDRASEGVFAGVRRGA